MNAGRALGRRFLCQRATGSVSTLGMGGHTSPAWGVSTRLARTVLFAVNAGLRESNVCGLE